jgi:methyl-accepting chemotaxis protein
MFQNAKLGMKVAMALLVLSVIALMTGIIGIVNIKSIEKADTMLYEKMTVGISDLGDISTYFQRMRINVRDLADAANAEEARAPRETIKDLTSKISTSMTEYENTIMTQEGKEKFATLGGAMKDYYGVIDQIETLKSQGKNEEVNALIKGNGKVVAGNTQKVIDELVDLKEKQAKETSASNSSKANTAVGIMIAVILAGIFISLGMGFFFYRNIKSIIGSLLVETERLVKDAVEGKLATRADTEKINFEFRGIPEGFNRVLDAVIGPFNVAAEYIDRISKGDIPPRITDTYLGDYNEIKNNLNNCIDNVNALVGDAATLAKAAIEGKLATRADATKHMGDFRKIVEGVNDTLDAVIGPLNVAAEYVDRISKGEIPPRITDSYNGDFNEIKNNLNNCIDGLQGLVECDHILNRMALNDHTKGVEGNYIGIFGSMAKAANDVRDRLVGVTRQINEIAMGNTAELAELRKVGKRCEEDKILPAVIDCMGTVEMLITDTAMLARAAVDGKLATRADAEKHHGEYRKVVQGINDTLDAVIGPLNVAAEYVDRISKGDIPPRITDNYNGDFNEIKNNLNNCIDNVNALVTETAALAKAAVEGKLATRADATKHQGDFRKIVEGVNDCLDSVIGPLNVAAEYVDRISKGDIPPRITDNYNGDFNEIKNNLNNCIDIMNNLLEEAGRVITAAADGELDKRADEALFIGGWKKLVAGINEIITNIVNPLMVTADYVEKVSKGIIPPQITDTYKGQYNVIKNNLNAVVKMMSELLAETDKIITAAAEGELDQRANAGLFVGGWNKLVAGVNDTITNIVNPLMVTANYVDQISKGTIPVKITDNYKGQYNIIKSNLNGCIDAINNMITDTNVLVKAAIEGKLATRADAAKHQGDFRRIVEGVNETLDAVISPLNVAAEYVDRISKGDIPPRITDNYNGDFNEIKNNLNMLIESMDEITHVAQEISEGNLSVSVKERSGKDTLMQALDKMLERLTEIVMNVQAVANEVAEGSRQMSEKAEQVSQGSSEQAASAEEVSSSMEQMSSNIMQNSDNAQQTEKIATKSAEEAKEGGESVIQTVGAMREIASKISIIEEIARQTNMLALNAAIEAARAGEHGKGFAVVAAEVRKLAERSQNAAGEINSLSASSVQVAEKAGDLLTSIVPAIQKTSDLVQEISSASNEQRNGAEQINKAIQQLESVIQQNAAGAEEMASTTAQLNGHAEQLQAVISFFRLDEIMGQGPKMISGNAAPAKLAKPAKVSARSPRASVKTKSSDKGVFLDMEGKGGPDTQDSEFEKY